MEFSRRSFLKQAVVAGGGVMAAPAVFGMPTVLTPRRVSRPVETGTLVFRPYYVQSGVGPHLHTWAYATDTKWDAIRCDITSDPETGVAVSSAAGEQRIGVNPRWNVEGFGYLFLTADGAGEHYELPPAGQTRELNLNYELARSRVARNERRLVAHRDSGWTPSREVQGLLDLSQGHLEDARKATDEGLRAERSQTALRYALWGAEMLEMDHARYLVRRQGYRPDFFVGCDARTFYQMDPDLFMDLFEELFNYATITHYTITQTHGMPDFEPVEDDRRFDTREVLLDRLRGRGITVEGRPLFWPYLTVTPDWLRNMKYDDLRRYVERHVRDVVTYYGDRMYAWEVVNEFHDWANEVQITPDQAVEITKLACDVAADAAPNVHRLINNCCPFAEYVQNGRWNQIEARYPQRTPWEFMRDLVEADVNFTITGQQMYFPYRDLQDTMMLVERFEQFGRPVQLTEVGASSGPSRRSVFDESLPFPDEPYIWRRPWDEELQADWLEGLYTLSYSKPWIEAVNWYDFMDGQAWIKNGGLISGPEGEKKAAFIRLQKLQEEWRALGQQG